MRDKCAVCAVCAVQLGVWAARRRVFGRCVWQRETVSRESVIQ